MKNLIERNPMASYFVLAFFFSWLILSPGVASTLGLIDFQFEGTVLTILGGLGPLFATIVVTWITEGGAAIGLIFRNMLNWRVKAKWWAAAVLLMAALFGAAVALGILIDMPGPDPSTGIYLNGGNIILVILLLLLGSFGEEPGWRGFALPKLQENRKPIKANLILIFFWWLWHIPTYWTLPLSINAAAQYGFAAAFGMNLAALLGLGILCAWVYNGSEGSVLMPVLLHAGWNFWSGAFGQDVAMFLLPLFLLTTIIVGFATKGKLGLMDMEKS